MNDNDDDDGAELSGSRVGHGRKQACAEEVLEEDFETKEQASRWGIDLRRPSRSVQDKTFVFEYLSHAASTWTGEGHMSTKAVFSLSATASTLRQGRS